MKFFTMALLATLLFVGVSTAKADRKNPIGVGTVIQVDTQNFSLGAIYDLVTIGNNRSDVFLNLGGYISQLGTRNTNSLAYGPQINVDYKRLFVGAVYNWRASRTDLMVGFKF